MTVIDPHGRTPAQKQGLLSQLAVPRPIAMISSLNADGGLNVAPAGYDETILPGWKTIAWQVVSPPSLKVGPERITYADHETYAGEGAAGTR